MKIILIAVSSIDGKLTKGNDPDIYSWSSIEDQKLFFSLVKKHNLIVMGGKTYDTIKHTIKHKPGKLRVIMTRNPKKYKNDSISGQLEFSDKQPAELVSDLRKRGYSRMLLVGGSIINGLFLKKNLVHELYLTLEPKLFGNGKSLIEKQLLDLSLELLSIKKINRKGTLFLRYKIIGHSSV